VLAISVNLQKLKEHEKRKKQAHVIKHNKIS